MDGAEARLWVASVSQMHRSGERDLGNWGWPQGPKHVARSVRARGPQEAGVWRLGQASREDGPSVVPAWSEGLHQALLCLRAFALVVSLCVSPRCSLPSSGLSLSACVSLMPASCPS